MLSLRKLAIGPKLILAATMLLMVLPMGARADIYNFYAVTSNSAADVEIGKAQLSMTVTDPTPTESSNDVSFYFSNAGPCASSICDVYFYDGTFIVKSSAFITGTKPGVAFSAGAKPAELSGYKSGQLSVYFSADSDAPVQPDGVNPGEWLKITFNLKKDRSFSDITEALALGDLVVGIHVQGFADQKSESFINGKVAPIPPSVFLMGSGLVGLGLLGWRRRSGR